MKFTFWRTADSYYFFDDEGNTYPPNQKVELNSLEDLIEWAKERGRPIILHANGYLDTETPCLEIYDDWRE